ncbi:hypothetical protein [uncultured Gimesia sp.]|uniref:hypothetical protein n=1 Tax=uncultured Gimesia sp. TaxID=1678688 RepID=UPI0030DA78B5|tara:strand:- start:40126 stop:40293 length:168 start_codon:yes stop_codon:yes gene_type:complete
MKLFRFLILTCLVFGFLDLAGAEEQGTEASRKPRQGGTGGLPPVKSSEGVPSSLA